MGKAFVPMPVLRSSRLERSRVGPVTQRRPSEGNNSHIRTSDVESHFGDLIPCKLSLTEIKGER